MNKKTILHCGDNIEILKKYADNSIDSIVTDSPYGLGKEPNPEIMLQAWITKGYAEIQGKGFMGKKWDAFVPQPIFWKEVFRVLKHGGFVLSFFGTRTYDWGVMAMRLAGFEIKDTIYWHYGCLSDDTEILTKSGYIQYHKFIKLPNFNEIEILIHDHKRDIYKWEKPERWNEYNINKDTCYRIKSDNTDQIVSRNHRCLVEREGELLFLQAESLSEMEYLPTLPNNFFDIQEGCEKILFKEMQRTLSGSRLEEMGKDCFANIQFTTEQNKKRQFRREEPILEGGGYIPKKERILLRSQVEICKMSKGVYSDGEKRWLCSGVSVDYGEAVRQTFIKNGMCASYRPQSDEQRYSQSDAICNKQRTQAIRTRRSYSTTLATITPIEYSGVIFCPTVSTGAFVARRNGKIFITGNSGFPKSMNISKQIKEEEDSEKWEGFGTAIKPASEPIVMARKPIEKGLTIAENVLKWGTGAINIDGCRVGNQKMGGGTNPNFRDVGKKVKEKTGIDKLSYGQSTNAERIEQEEYFGRFPANLILTHHPECEFLGYKKIKGQKDKPTNRTQFNGTWNEKTTGLRNNTNSSKEGYGDENGEETIENWNCHCDCPIKILDTQSGNVGAAAPVKSGQLGKSKGIYGDFSQKGDDGKSFRNDSGGASRFFYVAKASQSERNRGLCEQISERITPMSGRGQAGLKCKKCEKWKNSGNPCNCEKPEFEQVEFNSKPNFNGHPTVKPVKLMQYLVRLVTPSNGVCLDPFVGSGTTGIACKLEKIDFVGIDITEEYIEISKNRIQNWDEKAEYEYLNIETIFEENISEEENRNEQLSLF